MGHSHHHNHAHCHSNINRSFNWAITINLTFSIIEIIYALIAHSMSLLADAGHNFFDAIALLISLLGVRLLKSQASARYSYGLKRTSIFTAVINAAIIMATTIAIAVESFQRIAHPAIVDEKILIIVAAIGIFINAGTALLFTHDKHDLNVRGAFLHLMYDALISLGVVATGVVIYYMHWYWLDPVIGIIIAIIIFTGTFSLLKNSIDLLLDAVPHHIDKNAIETYLKSLKGVAAIHDLHIWALSTQDVALTVHLVMPQTTLTDSELFIIQDTLAKKFKIQHPTIQIEKNLDLDCRSTKECC